MATYYITNSDNVVNGNTFCDGSPCTAADIIIINGGARGNLSLQNFNGSGSYIPILNENADPNEKVVVTSTSSGQLWAALELRDCKYVDLRGDNDADLPYGIKVIQTPSTTAKTVWARQECDHIKLGYIEMCYEGAPENIVGGGLMVHDGTLSEAWIFDTFEIHHNYIHDCDYAGMYLGHNSPPVYYDPYCANFSVHHNLLEDMGAYGITLKGIHSTSGTNLIYNNTIRGSSGGQSTGLVTAENDSFKFGIGGSRYYGSAGCNVYNNYIEKTVGNGISAGIKNQNVYDNIVCGCGTGNTVKYGNGLYVHGNEAANVHFYDNIIIQPTRYGVYAAGTATSALMSRNLIGDAGIGEWGEEAPGGDLTESTGDDANWYEADVASFGFTAWSDDGDYSNDVFTFGGTPYTRSRGILRQKPRYNVPGGRFR